MSPTTPAKSLLSALFVSLATVAAAPAAPAAGPPPKPKSSAVEQYVELIPTSSGSAAPGIGKTTTKALPPQTSKALRAAVPASAAALEAVATSSSYGAPTTTLPAASAKPPARPAASAKPPARPSSTSPHEETPQSRDEPPAAVSSTSLAAGIQAAGSGGGQILVFGLALLALGAGMVAAAARRGQI